MVGNSITFIESHAFAGFKNLESATILNSVENIDYHTFTGCISLKTVDMSHGKNITQDTFKNCPVVFKITYVVDSENAGNPATYTDTKNYSKNQTRERHRFTSWYTDQELNNKIESIPANSYGNIMLYAKFVEGVSAGCRSE